MNKTFIGVSLAFATTVSWSILAIALKVANKFLDSMTIVGLRFLLSSTFLLMILLYRTKVKKIKIMKPPLFITIVAGLLLGLNYITYMYGIELTSASNAQLFIQTGPLVLLLWGVFVCKDKINLVQSLALFLSVVGFYLFYQDHINNFLGHEIIYQKGSLIIIVSAFFWAFFAILQKRIVSEHSALLANLIIFSSAFVPFSLQINWALISNLTVGQLLLVIYLGFNTCFAYGCLALAFRYIESSRVSIVITLGPILTILLIEILNAMNIKAVDPEPLRLNGYIGAILVVLAAIIIILRASKDAPAQS